MRLWLDDWFIPVIMFTFCHSKCRWMNFYVLSVKYCWCSKKQVCWFLYKHSEKLPLHLSLTELQRSDCTVTDSQDEMMDSFSPASARCGPRCQHKPQRFRLRPMHQSTLSLGDTPPCYTTTHTQVSPQCGVSSIQSLFVWLITHPQSLKFTSD